MLVSLRLTRSALALPMKNEPQLPRLIALTLLAVPVLLAGAPAFAQQPPSTVFRTSLPELSAGNYSYSTKADLKLNGAKVGGVAVHHAEVSISGRHKLTTGLRLAYGLDYDTNLLAADAAVPLPDQLSVFSLNLGLIRPLNSEWTAALFARPGFYSDFEDVGSRSLNAPVLVTATYTPRREIVWTFAFRLDPFAKNTVLPVLGVRWQFAPGWNFELGFPHTGLTWQVSGDLALRIDLSFQGGSYRVMHAPAAVPALGGTLLDYREIRAGAGFDFQLANATTLSLEAGFVTDRRFDYHERNYRLKGDPAGYLKLSFQLNF